MVAPVLPEEILHSICQFLTLADRDPDTGEGKIRLQTLLSISRASRTGYRAAVPALYHTLTFDNASFDTLDPILNACLQNPSLTTHVKRINVAIWDLGDEFTPNRATPELASACHTAAEKIGLSDNVLKQLQHDREEGLRTGDIALLLCMCPNLRALDLRTMSMFEDTAIMTVLSKASVSPLLHHYGSDEGASGSYKPFRRLEEVHLAFEDREYMAQGDPLQVTGVLNLPALRIFRVTQLTFGLPMEFPAAMQSTVKKIDLVSVTLDEPMLARLLSACPQLKILSLHCRSFNSGNACLDYSRVGAILRRLGSKITTLRLELHTRGNPGDSRTALGCLKEMTELKLLSVPWDTLFIDSFSAKTNDPTYLVETLPTSLRKLRIEQAAWDEDSVDILDEQVLELIQSEEFKELRRIRIQRRIPFSLDLADSPWEHSKTSQYWVILDKKNVE